MSMGDAYREAQTAVLGSLLIDPEPVAGIVMDALRPTDFSGEYRAVFEAARALWLERQPIDAVTVTHRAGAAYAKHVRGWMEQTPTAANVRSYVEIVREEAALVRLQSAALAVARSGSMAEAREALREMEPAMVERPELRAVSVTEMVAEFVARADDKKPPDFLRWGIRALDEKLTAEKGDFILLGADSSVGKTALALQFAWAMAAAGKRVGFFSLETSLKKLADRLIAQRARVELEAIKRRTLTEEDYHDIVSFGGALKGIPLECVEAGGCGVSDVRAVTVSRRYEVIFIDYVQLLRTTSRKARWEEVSDLSMALHSMAQELGVAVIALSQLTTEKTDKARRAPTKDDLRESRQLKQDADLILLMSLSNPEDPGSMRWLKADKNKDGPPVNVCLRFDPRHMDFTATDSRAWESWGRKKKRTFTETEEPTPFDGQGKMDLGPAAHRHPN